MGTDGTSVLIWASEHLQIIGWPMLVGIVWKLKDAIDKYLGNVDEIKADTKATERMALEIHGAVNTIQNNHLAHLAQDIKSVDNHFEKHTEYLASIDKNIALLVDRSSRS